MLEFDESFLSAIEALRTAPLAQPKRAQYLHLLDPHPGDRVLDLGCGGGWFSRTIAPLVVPGGAVVGVDRAPQAVALAASLAGEATLENTSFQCADAHSLPFAAATFDAVVCVSVLLYCEQPRQVLAEARRVLRPGGRLVVASSDEDTRQYNGHDRALGRRVVRAIADRGRDPWAGRRLAHLLESSGFQLTHEAVLTDFERRFAPGMSGFTLAHACRDYLTTNGGVSVADYEAWLADLRACEWEGSYTYGVTTYAYRAER